MKVVVQRVISSELKVDDKLVSKIGKGLIVFLGIKTSDTEKEINYLAHKVANLRVFEDENEKMNLSVKDIGGEIMLVSQFTLYGNLKKGFRPSYTEAARPEVAVPLYEKFIDYLKDTECVPTQTGVFGADMKINYINDGPCTIILEKEEQ